MKANELTEGIYVYFNCFDGSKIIVKVTGFKDGVVYGVSEDGAHWCQLSQIEPIPLTPEILEKNGWKDISDHTLMGSETFRLKYEQNGFDFTITLKLRDYLKIQSYDDRYYTLYESCCGVKFVHQLQHALRLCRIEKEIEL